jgi:hypothetical protein
MDESNGSKLCNWWSKKHEDSFIEGLMQRLFPPVPVEKPFPDMAPQSGHALIGKPQDSTLVDKS